MPEPDHCSYLLRLWRTHPTTAWRVTVIAVAAQNTPHHFATLADGFAFLQAQANTRDGCLEPGATDAPPLSVALPRVEGDKAP